VLDVETATSVRLQRQPVPVLPQHLKPDQEPRRLPERALMSAGDCGRLRDRDAPLLDVCARGNSAWRPRTRSARRSTPPLSRLPDELLSQHLMALRVARSAVKMGSPVFCGWVIVVWVYPVGRAWRRIAAGGPLTPVNCDRVRSCLSRVGRVALWALQCHFEHADQISFVPSGPRGPPLVV
jgi:hypothetical protein